MQRLNAACATFVEIVALSVLTLAILSLFSAIATKHPTISQTIDATHAIVSGEVEGIAIRQRLALYRFNPDWKLPIGQALVERTTSSGVEISINENEMRWPLGRYGTITRGTNGEWLATVGARLGFQKGDRLSIFRGRSAIGLATITSVSEDISEVEIPSALGDVSNLVVGEYGYATQVPWQPKWASFFEGVTIALFMCAYAAWRFFARRSPLLTLGEYLRTIPVSSSALFWPVNILAAVPFAWFMTKMPLYLFAYFFEQLSGYFGGVIHLRPFADVLFPLVFASILAISYCFLAWRRSSPILALWHFVSYKRPSTRKPTVVRGIFLWALHLVIVYVFASILINFLVGDIANARATGPHPRSLQELADFWKYVIWSLTVVGCLVGYGYSVVSILWGRFMRNLDFTIVGWLTNGFCYPFLGVVIWQIVPSFTGLDPIITGGPLSLFTLILGSILNLLYMLSIWNLGTMFDLMADKGVRMSLFYSAIRHPNYTLEAMMFFVTELVGLSSGLAWLGISVYFFLYWIRSEREDNFMWYSNPAYAEYQKQTPYKFIPGIY